MKAIINGLNIEYVEHGHGLPVVFVHGFPFSSRMWEPQLIGLPDYIRRIAFDIRGFGQSDVGDGQYMLEFFVDDLIGLLDHLGIDKAVICGLSMGGYVVLRALERHSDRFLGAVLCDTKSTADDNEAKQGRVEAIRQVRSRGVAHFAADFVRKVFAPATVEANPSIVAMIQDVVSLNSERGIVGGLLALASRRDTTAALSSVQNVPVLIMVGEHDEITPVAVAQDMQSHISNVVMHIVPNAAHMSNIENPVFFNEKLLDFLNSIRQERLDDIAG